MKSRSLMHETLLALTLLFLLGASRVSAQGIENPPELWDIATGELIPGAEVLKTKDFGAIIADVAEQPRRPRVVRPRAHTSLPEGLRSGDIILAVDSLRTYGWREFVLARFRNALSSTMTLLINRKGDLQWVKLHDLKPGRPLGLKFDLSAEQSRFIDEVETLGVAVTDAKMRMSLEHVPSQAAAALDAWAKAQKPPGKTDTAWLSEFIDLYSSLQRRHYSDAVKPAHEPPLPYFQRLERFYLMLAAENKAKEVPPDVEKSGEFAEYYVLALPVPDYHPPLGDLKFSDRRFQLLLTRKYANPGAKDPEILAAAQKYFSSTAGGVDQYLDQIKAALLDPSGLDVLTYHSPLLEKQLSRNLLVQQLGERMKEPTSPDWVLEAYAMTALDMLTGARDKAATLIEQIGKQSPYLARCAASDAFEARHAARSDLKTIAPIKAVLERNGDFLGSEAPEIYRWALKKVGPPARASQEINPTPLTNPFILLTKAPYAELIALKGLQPSAIPIQDSSQSEADEADQ